MGYTVTAYDYGQVINGVDTCLTPVLTPNGGAFDTKQTVSLTTDSFASLLYYTIDGADPVPGADGTKQTYGTVSIEGDHVLRVVAKQLYNKLALSPVATASFKTPDKTGPSYVKNILVSDNTSGHAVTLTWVNPSDPDYDHVDISCTEGIPTRSFPKSVNSATFSGLSESTSYDFKFVPYDTTGNAGTSATTYAYTPDTTPPTATITTSESGYTNLEYINFKLTLSEKILSFNTSSVVASGATLSSPYYDSTNGVVTFQVSPTNAIGTLATVSWKIPAGSFKDIAGNPNAEISWSIQHFNANLKNIWATCTGTDANTVYAIDYESKNLVEYDVAKRAVMQIYPFAARPISMKRGGGIIYIALDQTASLARFDLSTKSFLSNLSTPSGRYIHDFMVDAPRNRILLLDYDSSLFYSDSSSYAQFVDISSGKLLSASTPKVIQGTSGVLSPNGDFGIFMAKQISPISLERYAFSGDEVGTAHTTLDTLDSVNGFMLSPDGSTLCCYSYSAVVKCYSTAPGTALLKTSSALSYIAGVVYSPDGGKLYMTSYKVSSTYANKLLTVDPSSLSIISSSNLGSTGADVVYPCITSDGDNLVAFASKSSNSYFVCTSLK